MAKREIGGIEYELVRRKGMKNIRIVVKQPDGPARVSAPMNMPTAAIDGFVSSHRRWIEEQQRKMANRPARMPCAFESGEQVFLWGKPLVLRVERGSRSRCSVARAGDSIVIEALADASTETLSAAYERYLKKELEDALSSVVPDCERRTGLACTGWSIRKMETRWGSCTYTSGKVRFALKLALYPPECLEMVVIHELGHLSHHDHGPEFKAHMDKNCPNWRQTQRLLKD